MKTVVLAWLMVCLIVFSGSVVLGEESFFELIQSGYLEEVMQAIEAGANPNVPNDGGMTPLMWAAGFRDREFIRILLEAGAKVHARDEYGNTPLMWAAGENPDPEVTRYLLEAGAEVDAHNKLGQTPLMAATTGYQNPEIFRILLEAGAEVNARDEGGRTPLMWAVRWNQDPRVIWDLLEAGADVNARDEDGNTPLMWAARENHDQVITLLLEAGAEVDARCHVGKTAYDYARDNAYLLGTEAYRLLEEAVSVHNGVPGLNDVPTVTLPLSNLLEVRKDLIRQEGNEYPGGWGEYHAQYAWTTSHHLEGEEAFPFGFVHAGALTLEMRWVEILRDQYLFQESDAWAEHRYQDLMAHSLYILGFSVWLAGSEEEPEITVEEEYLRFEYQDNTGSREEGIIQSYDFPFPSWRFPAPLVIVEVPLPDNPEDITWFSLEVFNTDFTGKASMRWVFRENSIE